MPNGAGGGGGGGGPIGSGNSFVGPQSALEVVGDHIYGYTGIQATVGDNSYRDIFDYTTGNLYVVGFLTIDWASGNADDLAIKLSLNDAVIGEWYQSNPPAETTTNPVPIIIPAYTNVKVAIKNAQGSTARDCAALITGRIYRG